MKTFFALCLLFAAGTVASDCPIYVPDENDIIVMDTEQRGPGGGWEFQKFLSGYQGSGYLAYKPDSHFGGAEKPPMNMSDRRIKTYYFTVNRPGLYRVVMKSAAPHWTEHNDIFMSLPESGALKRKRGILFNLSWPLDQSIILGEYVDPRNWFKVYQNEGDHKWHWGGKNEDHNGHDILTRHLEPGKIYSLRMCGRSTRFNVDRFALYHCEDHECNNGSKRFDMATYMSGEKQSACVA